jgi:hypothetical protein
VRSSVEAFVFHSEGDQRDLHFTVIFFFSAQFLTWVLGLPVRDSAALWHFNKQDFSKNVQYRGLRLKKVKISYSLGESSAPAFAAMDKLFFVSLLPHFPCSSSLGYGLRQGLGFTTLPRRGGSLRWASMDS